MCIIKARRVNSSLWPVTKMTVTLQMINMRVFWWLRNLMSYSSKGSYSISIGGHIKACYPISLEPSFKTILFHSLIDIFFCWIFITDVYISLARKQMRVNCDYPPENVVDGQITEQRFTVLMIFNQISKALLSTALVKHSPLLLCWRTWCIS